MFTLKDAPGFGSFSVNDLDKAKEFYGDVLGLEIKEEEGMGLRVHVAGCTPVFVYPKEGHAPATFTVLNFSVDDIDGAVAGLKEKGVTFEKYEGGMIETDENGIARGRAEGRPDIAWFKDPAGNVLSVLQE